ncbi:MAG: DUF4132 domain-containing protein [Planctomycetota bacterium]
MAEARAQLARLEERSSTLGEADSLPRGALPALFRALRAHPELAREALDALALRLADWPLVEPVLELVEALELEAPFVEALGAQRTWAVHLQLQALRARCRPSPRHTLALLRLLLDDGDPDPTALCVEVGAAELSAALPDMLRARTRSPTGTRDRTSQRLTRGVIRVAMQVAGDLEDVRRAISQLIVAETRRVQTGDSEVALEALGAMHQAAPSPVLRLVVPLLETLRPLRKRTLIAAAEALRDDAAARLGASEQHVAELTARRGGLDPDGVLRVPLEAGDAELRYAPSGALERSLPGDLERGEDQELARAEEELQAARGAIVERLQRAMLDGRTWPLAVWCAAYCEHPLGADVARRLVWELLPPEGAARPFALADPAGPELQDLFADPLELAPESAVRLVHPLRLDPEALELWREHALDWAWVKPFPQLFRAVALPEDPAEALADFQGRELRRDEVGALLQDGAFEGEPTGLPPWRFRAGRGLTAIVAAPPPPRVRERTHAAGKRAKPAPVVKDPSPRLLLEQVELTGELDRVTLAEALRALHRLTDPLAVPDDLWLRQWQQNRWRDPENAWREVVLRYRRGAPGDVEVRRWLLERWRGAREFRLEDRFAVTRAHVIELATGLVHQGHDKVHLPQHRVEELIEPLLPELRFPFVESSDPETVAIVRRVLALASLPAPEV